MSKGGGDDNATSVLILIGVGIIGLMVLMNALSDEMAQLWRWLRIAQFSVLGAFEYDVVRNIPVIGWLGDISANFFGFIQTRDYLLATPVCEAGRLGVGVCIEPEFRAMTDDHFAKWLSWIPAMILGVLGARLVMRVDNVGRVFDMESMLKDRSRIYTFLERFVEKSPVDEPLHFQRGIKSAKENAIALTPEKFARLSPPLGLERAAKKKKSLKSPIWDGHLDFDSDLAERTFIAQLGAHYRGLGSMKPSEKAVFDALKVRVKVNPNHVQEAVLGFVRVATGRRKAQGLSQIERRIVEAIKHEFKKEVQAKQIKKSVYSPNFANTVIKNKSINKLLCERHAEQVMNRHAFTRVGLMSLLEEARNAGVVPSLEFRHWLKEQDRVLWYCMSTVGRRVSFVENAGVMAQWLFEKEIGRPSSQPFVDEAIVALKQSLRIDERLEIEDKNRD